MNKRPRQLAQSIARLKTKHERVEALNEVPEEYKAWVKKLVVMSYERLHRSK